MIPPEVSAVLVTRGDVDLAPILTSLQRAGFGEALICDNRERTAHGQTDLGPFGQFHLAQHGAVQNAVVYFQDDDVLVSDPAAIVAAWKPGLVVCNMPEQYRAGYERQPDKLMGFGSVFERELIPKTLRRYFEAGYTVDNVLWREPGRLFTALNPVELVDVPITHLPWATAENRLYRQRDHGRMAEAMRERARRILEKG